MPWIHLLVSALGLGGASMISPKGGSCPTPAPGWVEEDEGLAAHHRPVLRVQLQGREIIWDGRAVSRETLARYLAIARSMNPAPFILFDPAAAEDCALATNIRDLIHREANCGEQVPCRQGHYREW